MSQTEIHHEVAELVAAFLEGELDDAQREKLNQLLLEDESARETYRLCFAMHSDLHWDAVDRAVGLEAVGNPDDEQSGGLTPADDAPVPQPHATRAKSLLDRASDRPFLSSIVVAAMLFLALFAILAFTPVGQFLAGEDKPGEELKPEPPAEIATLTNWHRPEWVKEHAISPRNHRITAGQKIAFTSGMIELTYDTGAKVVIEGPAEFVVGGTEAADSRGQQPADDANSGFLSLGRLVARCETPDSQGFVVGTPTTRVADLGTEFGVDVGEDGAAEVVVLKGAVEMTIGDGNGPERRMKLTKGQGAFVAAAAERIQRRDEVDVQFVKAMRSRLAMVDSGQYVSSQSVPMANGVIVQGPDSDHVAFEAELGTAMPERPGWVSGGVPAPPAGSSGGAWIVNSRDHDAQNPRNGPAMVYVIDFATPGEYTAYFRVAFTAHEFDRAVAGPGGNDSFFYENGDVGPSASFRLVNSIEGIGSEHWKWFKQSSRDIRVRSAGSSTWKIIGREDGMMIDRIVLSARDDLREVQLDDLSNSQVKKQMEAGEDEDGAEREDVPD